MPDGSRPNGAHREAHGDRTKKRQTEIPPDTTAIPPRCDLPGFKHCRQKKETPGFRHTEATRGTQLAERGWVACPYPRHLSETAVPPRTAVFDSNGAPPMLRTVGLYFLIGFVESGSR